MIWASKIHGVDTKRSELKMTTHAWSVKHAGVAFRAERWVRGVWRGAQEADGPRRPGLTRSTVVVYDYDQNRRGTISEKMQHALEVHSKAE